jgi:hypothetical protein
MSSDLFDLHKIQRNFELASSPHEGRDRLKAPPLEAPADPFAVAREELAAAWSQASSELSAHDAALRPFFERVAAAIDALEAAHHPPSSGEGQGERPDLAPLREELDDALFDLEDMLEVFTMPPR